jgi:hypothetical protein
MSTSKETSNDEIDLLELFRRIGKTIGTWFIALAKGILISVVFLIRRWLPLGLSLVIAVGFSYVLKKSFTPCYASNLVIRSNSISNADMIAYLNRLHTFCLEKNAPALATALSISEDQAKNLKDIEAYWIIDKNNDGTPDFIDYKNRFNVYDTVNKRMPDRIAIRAKFSALEEIQILRNGLFSFVNTNTFYKHQNDLRLTQVDAMMVRLDYDIEQLDSLQKIKYFEETKNRFPEKTGQMIFLQEQKTQLIYEDIHNLFRRKQSLEQEKNLYPDIITLLSDFTIPARPYTGLKYYSKVTIPLFFGITLLILIFLANRKKLRELLKKY